MDAKWQGEIPFTVIIEPGGKIVYGGGGIMPDIFVPMITDSIHTFYNIQK